MLPRVNHALVPLLAAYAASTLSHAQMEPPTPQLRAVSPVASPLPSRDLAAEAASDGLWEIAADHLERAITSAQSPAERESLALRLAEAWIRDQQPDRALILLEESFLANHPAKRFWRAQALAALGRFSESAAGFEDALAQPGAPFAKESALSLAQLRISLGQEDQALQSLQRLADSSEPETSVMARLWMARLLMDLNRTADARNAMPQPISACPKNLLPQAVWTESQLLLAEKKQIEAAKGFRSLLDDPTGLPLPLYHSAASGLTRAWVESGQSAEAVKFLLEFIQKHPNSPELASLFAWLDRLLPEKPTLTDPILTKLLQWIPPPDVPAAGLLNLASSGADSPCDITARPCDDRSAFSLHSRATGLRRVATPEAFEESKRLLTRLRWEFPEHFLSRKSLIDSALHLLATQQPVLAFSLLDSLRENAPSLSTKGQAAFLEARHAFDQGNLLLAASLFDEASEWLDPEPARAAALNAAVSRLRYDPSGNTLIQMTRSEDPALLADVQLERALCASDPTTRRSALEEFLSAHPSHPRRMEARLSAAEAALSTPDPDLSFARAQLDTLRAESQPQIENDARVAAITLRIADLDHNPDAAIASAKEVLLRFPNQPVANEATLILGRKWFETRNYNDARMMLEKFAASCDSPERAQAAWLLAARSAALVPTAQSRKEALILLDKVIDAHLSLAPVANLEKGRLLIDLNRLSDAEKFLSTWFASLQPKAPLYLPCGLLLGEAIYAQGSQRADSLTAALAVYDLLLAQALPPSADFNRIQYLRGRTLEQLADPADPTRKREKQAFSAYYSVLESSPPPQEWHYFELCGFRALTMLEKSSRWQAAVACARKIASFQGPRSKEAADRAEQIQLQQMIWED